MRKYFLLMLILLKCVQTNANDISYYQHDLSNDELEKIKVTDESYFYFPEKIALALQDLAVDETISSDEIKEIVYQSVILKKHIFTHEELSKPLKELIDRCENIEHLSLQVIKDYCLDLKNGDAQINVENADQSRSSSCKVFCNLIIKNCLTAGALHVRGNALIDGSLTVNGGINGLPPTPPPTPVCVASACNCPTNVFTLVSGRLNTTGSAQVGPGWTAVINGLDTATIAFTSVVDVTNAPILVSGESPIAGGGIANITARSGNSATIQWLPTATAIDFELAACLPPNPCTVPNPLFLPTPQDFFVCIPDRISPSGIPIPGTIISARSWGNGDGPYVLFSCAFATNNNLFYCQQQFLAAHGFRTICVELRGCGFSGKTDPFAPFPVGLGNNGGYTIDVWAGDNNAVLNALGITAPIWVTEDVSGLAGMLYNSVYNPGAIKKLAWISANAQYITPAGGSTWPYPIGNFALAEAFGLFLQTSPLAGGELFGVLDLNDAVCMIGGVVPTPELLALRNFIAFGAITTPPSFWVNMFTVALVFDVRPYLPGTAEVLLSYGTSQGTGLTNVPPGVAPVQATITLHELMPANSQLYVAQEHGFSHGLTDVTNYNNALLNFLTQPFVPNTVTAPALCTPCTAII